MEQTMVNRHFANFHIAGFGYWEGCLMFQALKVGTKLRLVREAENRFDPYAVAIYFKETKLGYVPRENNALICQLVDLGYRDIFDVRVQRLSPDAHPEKQVGVVVFLNSANCVFNK